MNKLKFALISASTAVMGVLPALAEAETPKNATAVANEIKEVIVPYTTAAQTAMVSVLTAGVVIVGGFFIWRVLKRALGASK